MKFTKEQAEQLGLVVGGKNGTCLVSASAGFEGRRIYIDRGSTKQNIAGPLIHLSGYTKEECEALGATANVHNEFSSRVTGFLKPTPENLAAAAKVIREATTPAYVPARSTEVAPGMDADALFSAAAASK